MKLLKKLLPIATVAATASVVAPMVTSCSKNIVFSTTDADWEMKDIHDETKIESQEQYNELVKDYFSTNKHLAEDFASEFISGYYSVHDKRDELQEMKSKGEIADFKISCEFKASNISFAPQTLNLGTGYGEVNGYCVNMTIYEAMDIEMIGPEKADGTRIDEIEIEKLTQTITNGFIAIQPVAYTEISILGHKDLDWRKEENIVATATTRKIKISTGAIIDENTINGNETKICTRDGETYTEAQPYYDMAVQAESIYLSKVTFDIK